MGESGLPCPGVDGVGYECFERIVKVGLELLCPGAVVKYKREEQPCFEGGVTCGGGVVVVGKRRLRLCREVVGVGGGATEERCKRSLKALDSLGCQGWVQLGLHAGEVEMSVVSQRCEEQWTLQVYCLREG